MKKWVIRSAVLLIIFIGAYLGLSFYAVRSMEVRVRKAMGPGLTIGEIKIKPTFLCVTGIRYEEARSKRKIFQSEEMRVYPHILSFLKGSLRIRECRIVEPQFFLYRSQEGEVSGPWLRLEREGGAKDVSGETERKDERTPVRIDRIRMMRGSLDIEDTKPSGSPTRFRLEDLNLTLGQIRIPLISTHSPIELNGKVKAGKKDGTLHLKGWVDLSTTDMELSLKAQEIDVKVFEPYYRKRVSAEIRSGSLNVVSEIGMRKRIIDAPGYLELTDLHLQEGGTIFWIPAKTWISLLNKKGNRLKVKFRIRGNVDDPQFNLHESVLNRLGLSIAENLGIPIKTVGKILLEGGEKGASERAEQMKAAEELFRMKEKER